MIEEYNRLAPPNGKHIQFPISFSFVKKTDATKLHIESNMTQRLTIQRFNRSNVAQRLTIQRKSNMVYGLIT